MTFEPCPADSLPFTPTVPAALRHLAMERGDAPVLLEHDRALTYAQLEQRSRRIAAGLVAQRIGKGSRVAVLFPNGCNFLLYAMAAARIGALVSPINTFSKPGELAYQLRHCDAEVLITAPQFLANDYLSRLTEAFPELANQSPRKLMLADAPYLRAVFVDAEEAPRWADPVARLDAMGEDVPDTLIESIERQVAPSDLFCVIYTSGSSADPKGVVHTQGAFLRRAGSIARITGIEASDVIYNPSPYFWTGGLVFLMGAFLQGAAVMAEGQFEPAGTLAFLERAKATIAIGWPHFAASMRAESSFAERDLSSLRGGNLHALLASNEAPPDPGLVAMGIGMTETAGHHTYPINGVLAEELRGAFGTTGPGIEMGFVDPDTGHPLAEGEEGELCVRGYSVMQGYYKKEREECFAPDGFFATGDLGLVRDGRFYFRGRKNDMIKTGGANVSPAEVRKAVLELPGVGDCIVIGIDDPLRGQVVAAAVIAQEGAQLDTGAMRQALKASLSSFKIPKVIEFMAASEIPMLPSAKLDRRGLIERLKISNVA